MATRSWNIAEEQSLWQAILRCATLHGPSAPSTPRCNYRPCPSPSGTLFTPAARLHTPGTMAQQLSDEQGACGRLRETAGLLSAAPACAASRVLSPIHNDPVVPVFRAVAEFKEAFSLFGKEWFCGGSRRLWGGCRSVLTAHACP